MTASKIFAAAIRAAGGEAWLVRDSRELLVTASIQPVFQSHNPQGSPLGPGQHDRFYAYFAFDDNADAVIRGDVIRRQGRLYHVRRVETVRYGDCPAYRKAELTLCAPDTEVDFDN